MFSLKFSHYVQDVPGPVTRTGEGREWAMSHFLCQTLLFFHQALLFSLINGRQLVDGKSLFFKCFLSFFFFCFPIWCNFIIRDGLWLSVSMTVSLSNPLIFKWTKTCFVKQRFFFLGGGDCNCAKDYNDLPLYGKVNCTKWTWPPRGGEVANVMVGPNMKIIWWMNPCGWPHSSVFITLQHARNTDVSLLRQRREEKLLNNSASFSAKALLPHISYMNEYWIYLKKGDPPG